MFRTAKQQMDLRPDLSEIHSIAGAEVQSQFGDAFADFSNVAK